MPTATIRRITPLTLISWGTGPCCCPTLSRVLLIPWTLGAVQALIECLFSSLLLCLLLFSNPLCLFFVFLFFFFLQIPPLIQEKVRIFLCHLVLWHFKITSLTLCILMDFPIHIDTISIGLSIVYFKGSKVEFSNVCEFLSLKVVAFHLGLHCLPKYPLSTH